MADITGIHHVTAITGDAQTNLDFYTGVLGMRLVKRTVNQDVPDTYHLFYADASGHPGTDLTFFPWPNSPVLQPGVGLAMEVALAVPAQSLDFWSERLMQHGVQTAGIGRRRHEQALPLYDPFGFEIALVATDDSRESTAWDDSPVPAEHQILGLHSVRLWERDLALTQQFLVDVLGFAPMGEEDGWHRYGVHGGGSGKHLDIRELPAEQRGRWGVGGIHHVAWRVPDNATELAVRERIALAHRRPTEVIDRFWFRSVYFLEPGGVLFEIATDGPGFTADENLATLGERLVLPPWLEPQREEIEGLSGTLCVGPYYRGVNMAKQTRRTRASRELRDNAAGTAGIDPALLDQLITGVSKPEQLEDVFRTIKKALVERVLGAELTAHLGYAPGEEKPEGQGNHRNGTTPKTVITDDGSLPLDIPRDRSGTFEPQFVPKNVRRLPGFDAKVLSLYARGLTVREIRGHLEEMYQVHVSPDVISTVTDAVFDEVTTWQQRPLDRVYPVVIFDAMRVKVRDDGVVRNKAAYLAIGVTRDGVKEVLGLWLELTENASFWLRVLSELQARGVADILIALVDGLTGFPDAITTVFPHTQVHQCTVHLVRQSLRYVAHRDRRHVAAELRGIYQAPSADAAQDAVDSFAEGQWGKLYPAIPSLWRRHWERIAPVFQYPPQIRRLLYTTNAIESLNRQLRKIIKTRGHFPNDEAALKLLYLALRNATATWRKGSRDWTQAMPHLALLFGDRFVGDV